MPRPLFREFAPRLLVSHPAEVKVAHGVGDDDAIPLHDVVVRATRRP